MKALCFTLEGKTAFFKKPEVNSYVYFTYGNIHKVALMGMFGAILGYGGYTQKFNKEGRPKQLEESFPEFYERLSDLKVAIRPNAEKGFISKKIQTFNNSVGYASKELGGNLIVKEQWLENPSWEIYILLDCPEAMKLSEALQAGKCVYIPYLGKNDHGADIRNVRIEELTERKSGEGKIYDLFPKENGMLQMNRNLLLEEKTFLEEDGMTYKYEEKLPYELNAWTNNYILKSFIYTDVVVVWENQEVYCNNGNNIMFY